MKKVFLSLLLSVLLFGSACSPLLAGNSFGAERCRQSPCMPALEFSGMITPKTGELLVEWFMLQSGPSVFVMDTPGGDMVATAAIIGAIRQSGHSVHCIVNGEAKSAGFWLLEACTTRAIVVGSKLMTHMGVVLFQAPATEGELVVAAEFLHYMNDKMVATISQRLNLDPVVLRSKMAKEWWLTPQEALDAHVVDLIIDDPVEYKKELRKDATE